MSHNDDHDEFADLDSDYAPPREDGQAGPPGSWRYPSWFDFRHRAWWWRAGAEWRLDPCPVRPLGAVNGEFVFGTAFGEIRRFTSNQLHNRGGLTDLFGGEMSWSRRHFRYWDPEKQKYTGPLLRERCVAVLIRWCHLVGYYDGSRPHRRMGVWRGPDGQPIVHAGDKIFYQGEVLNPGVQIGEALFVIDAKRQRPAHALIEGTRGRQFIWEPASSNIGRIVAAHLSKWPWESEEARDLAQGGLHCDMLGALLGWLPHKFILAPYGSGKSSLLRYFRSLVGGAAHNVQQTYSKAYLEQNFAGMSGAFYLDETESAEEERIGRIFELARQLSDGGTEGGRGSSSGKSRKLDLHGTVTMAATVTEEWPPQDRSRITVLELRPFADRRSDEPPESREAIEAMIQAASEMSAGLRARAVATWDLFQRNLKIARDAILEMGGTPRDADQLGHLIAGWKTMTSDEELSDIDELARFRPYIMSLVEAEDGDDAPNDLLNILFSTVPDTWRSGERLTIGQLIAKGRLDDPGAKQWRDALKSHGMRLETQEGETWSQAWLWIADKHTGLDRLFAGYPRYQGKKRAQILRQLRCKDDEGEHRAQKSQSSVHFAGAKSRYLMVPPVFLPSEDDD